MGRSFFIILKLMFTSSASQYLQSVSNLYELHSSLNIFAQAMITLSSILLRSDSAISPARTLVEKNIFDFFSIVGIGETYTFTKVINMQIFNLVIIKTNMS